MSLRTISIREVIPETVDSKDTLETLSNQINTLFHLTLKTIGIIMISKTIGLIMISKTISIKGVLLT